MTAYQQAANWASSFNPSSIRSEEILHTFNIRQLKQIASMLNKGMGVVISKSKFGKVWSNMVKAELINAIWYVRRLVLCSPKGNYTTLELSRRISCQMCNGTQHVVYVGFDTEAEANKFYYWLNSDSSLSTLAAIRPADRMKAMGFKYEIKIWDIAPGLLAKLLAKDKAEIKPVAAPTHIEQIELATAQKMYDNVKSTLKGRNAMVGFLNRKGFEVFDHVVYKSAEF